MPPDDAPPGDTSIDDARSSRHAPSRDAPLAGSLSFDAPSQHMPACLPPLRDACSNKRSSLDRDAYLAIQALAAPGDTLYAHALAEGAALISGPLALSEDAGGGVARLFGEAVDRRLQALLAQDRATGRLDQVASHVLTAADRFHGYLEPLRQGWCQAMTTNNPRHARDGYQPSTAMRQLIEQRHPRCVFPACNQPSHRCDLDHTQPYGAPGGATCACNLAPLCRRHHRLKQTPGWHLRQLLPGLMIWITPNGTWHIVTPLQRE
jgi:hypothetical protein